MRSLLSGIAGIICMWLSSFCIMLAAMMLFAFLIGLLDIMFFHDQNPIILAAIFGLVVSCVTGFGSLKLARFLLKEDSTTPDFAVPPWLKSNTWRIGAVLAFILFSIGLAWNFVH